LYDRNGHLEQALDLFLEAFSHNPNDVQICSFIGKMYYGLGDFEKSLTYYKKALTLQPEDATLYNSLATVYKALHRDDMVQSILKEGSEKHPVLYEYLTKFYIDNTDYKNAEKSLKSALKFFPDNGVYLYNLAMVLKHLEKLEQAAEIFSRLIPKAQPNELPVYYNELGNIAFTKRDFYLAATYFQKAVELDVNNAVYQENLQFAQASIDGKLE